MFFHFRVITWKLKNVKLYFYLEMKGVFCFNTIALLTQSWKVKKKKKLLWVVTTSMVKLLFFHFWVTKKLEKYQTTLKLLIRKWKNKILISNHSRQLYWMKYHIIWNYFKRIQVCCFLWLQMQICHSIGIVYDHEITEYMYLSTLTIVIYL